MVQVSVHLSLTFLSPHHVRTAASEKPGDKDSGEMVGYEAAW